jgi:hypothetical protein
MQVLKVPVVKVAEGSGDFDTMPKHEYVDMLAAVSLIPKVTRVALENAARLLE